VELNAAHGYLINQFLSSRTNKRKDEYGGTLNGRMKFLLNIVKEIKNSVPEFVLSVRLNVEDFVPEGLEMAEMAEIVPKLEEAGADIINASCGTYESGLTSIEPPSYKEGWRVYLAEEVKKWAKIPVIAGGIIRDPAFADQIIENKQADFVFIGRGLLADSDWANKAQAGLVEDIRPCIMCNNCTNSFFKEVSVTCTVNPKTGREKEFHYYTKGARNASCAVVVGSGPAGMQAAISLRQCGLNVVLYEKEERLGGMLNLASIPPHKERIGLLKDFLVRQLYKSGVEIVLNRPCELDDLRER